MRATRSGRRFASRAATGAGIVFVLALLAWLGGCKSGPGPDAVALAAAGGDAERVIAERGLTPDDVYAAVKTYQPTGKHDEYVMLASGGHSGQVLAIGVPSMRLLKVVAVFTPEPWQGWGFSDETRAVLAAGKVDGKTISWAEAAAAPLCLLSRDMQNRRIVDQIFEGVGVAPRARIETNSFVCILSHVRSGEWSSIVPHTYVDRLGIAKTARDEKLRRRDEELRKQQEDARMAKLYRQHVLKEEAGPELVQLNVKPASKPKQEEEVGAFGD